MFGINIMAKYVEDKVANYGTEVIMGVVANSPVGAVFSAVSRFSEFVERGGKFKFDGMDLLEKLQASVQNPTRVPSWQRKAPWAKSRQEFLGDAWKHDWRSQPRNKIGEWVPGRTTYPVQQATAIGKGRQRSSRQRRRINRYRRYGRMAARSVKYGD